MKKIIFNFCFIAVAAFSLNSCKKQLDEKYMNPELNPETNVPGMFTAMVNNDRIAQKYWNVRTFLSTMTGVYSQTVYIPNSQTVYQQNDGYAQQYWDDFYAPGGNGAGVMAQYRSMERKFNSLSVEDQGEQTIFMEAGKIVLIEQAAKMVDLWGDIPYSEAGSLNTTDKIEKAKYDDQKVLYAQFISDLTAAATYFKSATTTSQFTRYDILLKGQVKMWERYANSLKLRLLMHTSMVDEANARTAIMAMLNDPVNFPLIDGGNNSSYSPAASDVLLAPLTNNQADLNSAYQEGSWYAPDYLLNSAMKPANDPRIPVFFEKFGQTIDKRFIPNADYGAMPITFTSEQQQNDFSKYSVMDSATFAQNINLPGFVITASEVNLLKAEAYERWGSSTSAKSAYDIALGQSIKFYFYMNSLSTSGRSETMPSDDRINSFIIASSASYKVGGSVQEHLEQIYTQKWIHLGLLQSIEAWTEVRRTDFPKLTFPSAGKLVGFEVPPTRLIYPSNEVNYNSENYQAVKSKDVRMGKIFWDVK